MDSSRTRESGLPERLRGVVIPLSFAARIMNRSVPGLWQAIQAGRLKAVPYPAGETQLHWQVTLGDLVDYTGIPLTAERLAMVEQCLNWQPGDEIRRVA